MTLAFLVCGGIACLHAATLAGAPANIGEVAAEPLSAEATSISVAALQEMLDEAHRKESQLKNEERIRDLLILVLSLAFISATALLLLYRSKLNANRGLTELNQRLGHQQEQLRAANEELSRLNKEMGEVLAVVSHDLKNPLVGIEGLSHEMRTMAEEAGDAQNAHMLAMIESSAHRMFMLVTDLLDLQRLEVGQQNLQSRPVELRRVAEDALSELESFAEEKGQRITIEAPEKVWALGDDIALARVVSNLLSNAIKYSPRDTKIRITLKPDPRPTLEVIDEGPGISPDESVKLFRKFSRISSRPTGGESSTGLGLAISKSIVDALSGRIWCKSNVAQGSTFGFSLPAAKPPEEDSPRTGAFS